MSNLTSRILTAIVFVTVLLGSIILHELSSIGLIALLIVLSLREFYQLFKKSNLNPNAAIGIASGLILFLTSTSQQLLGISIGFKLMVIPLIILIFIAELYRKQERPIENVAITLLGLIYIVLPFTLLHKIAYFKEFSFNNDYNYALLLSYLFILWSNDTGAYFVGKNLGKHKLFERISPKKTWEGQFGGIVAGLIVAYINTLLFPSISLYLSFCMAILIVVFGSLGDLVESLFKRSLNIKDSGNILPGHGGVLDRFDGIFISAPMVYVFLSFLAR